MSRVSSQAGTHSHSVLTQRCPLVTARSVRKASAHRGRTCIDGAARKNDHRMMLHESHIPPHTDHHAHLHTRNLRHMKSCARPDAYCVTARLRTLEVHCQRCPSTSVPRRALTAHYGAEQHELSRPVCAALPQMQPLRALSQEQRSGLPEDQSGGRECARSSGRLSGPAGTGGEVMCHHRGS